MAVRSNAGFGGDGNKPPEKPPISDKSSAYKSTDRRRAERLEKPTREFKKLGSKHDLGEIDGEARDHENQIGFYAVYKGGTRAYQEYTNDPNAGWNPPRLRSGRLGEQISEADAAELLKKEYVPAPDVKDAQYIPYYEQNGSEAAGIVFRSQKLRLAMEIPRQMEIWDQVEIPKSNSPIEQNDLGEFSMTDLFGSDKENSSESDGWSDDEKTSKLKQLTGLKDDEDFAISLPRSLKKLGSLDELESFQIRAKALQKALAQHGLKMEKVNRLPDYNSGELDSTRRVPIIEVTEAKDNGSVEQESTRYDENFLKPIDIPGRNGREVITLSAPDNTPISFRLNELAAVLYLQGLRLATGDTPLQTPLAPPPEPPQNDNQQRLQDHDRELAEKYGPNNQKLKGREEDQ